MHPFAGQPWRQIVQSNGATVSGDTLVAIALAGTLFFDVPIDAARTRVALYLLLTMAPFSVLAPLIGPAIDRRRGGHRLAIIAAAIGRAGLALVMAFNDDTIILYPAAFGILVLARAHAVGRSALLPRLVEPHKLVQVNATLVRAALLAGAAAAVPGVAVQRLIGSSPTLALAAAAYLAATLFATVLPRPRIASEAREVPDGRIPGIVFHAVKVNAIIRGLGGFLLMLLAFELRARETAPFGFALVLAATGVGSYIGATIVPRLKRGTNEIWMLAIALLIGGGASLFAAGNFALDLAAVVGASIGLAQNTGRLALDSLAQRAIPEARRGRLFARFETILQAAWVLGAALPVLIRFKIELGLGIACALFLGTALWYLITLGPEGRRALED